jgi:flagellar biosynthesis/type III secretory pathway chaperone
VKEIRDAADSLRLEINSIIRRFEKLEQIPQKNGRLLQNLQNSQSDILENLRKQTMVSYYRFFPQNCYR